MLAEPTFLGWRYDGWAALGIWATIAAYIALAVFAYRQLREARTLRLEQTRPFVIVDAAFRNILVQLSIKNIGRTAARDVRVELDERLISTIPGPDWQSTKAFTQGFPLIAPDRDIRFLIDSYPARMSAGHPMVICGTVSYSGPRDSGSTHYVERFTIDLATYEGAQLAEKGVHELVEQVDALRKELTKWTDGSHGLLVSALDRDQTTIRSERPFHIMRARSIRTKEGWRAAVTYFAELWRRRRGWYSR